MSTFPRREHSYESKSTCRRISQYGVAPCQTALLGSPPELGNAPWPIVTRLELRTSPVRPGQVGVGPSKRSPVEARDCCGVDLSPPRRARTRKRNLKVRKAYLAKW
ncbi:hypothetical protein ABEB36_011374 [Hypothenemus hampei]|uniref:Uncharacterized protein n=1 Tax=Hypothenemus hampei TaxID=57062 RepID=A0ABD1EFT5_HYPHA